MFRRAFPCLVKRSAFLLQSMRELPEGFEFIENKVVDADIHGNYVNLETLKFTLTRQDESIFKEAPVKSVSLTAASGEVEIHPGHAYEIMKVVPSSIEVEMADGETKKFFTSGGFAHVNDEGSCDVNTVECIPLDELDIEAAEKALAAQQLELSKAGEEKTKSVIEIRIGVLESVIQALKH